MSVNIYKYCPCPKYLSKFYSTCQVAKKFFQEASSFHTKNKILNNLQMCIHVYVFCTLYIILQRSSSVTKAMGTMMENLTKATYGAFKTYTSSQTSESVLLFVCSVARLVLIIFITNLSKLDEEFV
jgi:hypothetical protein